jgi:hypothetical protein
MALFQEAHEHGLDSLNPVFQGYDDKLYTRFEFSSPQPSFEENRAPEQLTTRINGARSATYRIA